MSLRLLRAEIWARDDVKKLHRVTVRSLPDGRIEGPAVVVMSRLVVTGGNHHRLHEELTEAGGYLRDAGFRREERVTEVRRWLEESQPAALSDATFDALRTRFDKQRDSVLAAVEARSKDRLRFLMNTIETRKRKEADDIRQVLDDLERALKTEIAAEQQTPAAPALLRGRTHAAQARPGSSRSASGPDPERTRTRITRDRGTPLQRHRAHLPGGRRAAGAGLPRDGEARMSNDHEWLKLVEVSGPFLAAPVLRDVFPQGLEALPSGRPRRLRRTHEEWRDAVDMDDLDLPALHAAWVDDVLLTALEMDGTMLRKGASLPERLRVSLPEHGVTVAPDLEVVNPTNADESLLLIHVYEPDTDLDATRRFDGLAITPADRMVALLRATGCPIGVVTNGERWMLVHAPVGAVAGFASWYARLWGQEPETLRAFVSLLGVRRFFRTRRGQTARAL